ncbi:MAG: sigma-70 family RNA polymerase sigma factor [Sediminibacterium sp.]|nr:sigma-70 family RNA polymerase sigma factor [Sediminibacterium sp.]
MEDVEIVAAFKKAATKERAFTFLVKKYQEKLYWHIRRLLPAHEDANDVLQNIFIKVWNGLESFREDSRLYTWLYRIATNESLSFLEQQKKKAAVDFDQLGETYSNSVRADENFDANRLEWKLQLAIRQLPDKQKLVFNLRYFDEMSYDEMSSILDTSAGALKASYHHAAKKIEEFIKNH